MTSVFLHRMGMRVFPAHTGAQAHCLAYDSILSPPTGPGSSARWLVHYPLPEQIKSMRCVVPWSAPGSHKAAPSGSGSLRRPASGATPGSGSCAAGSLRWWVRRQILILPILIQAIATGWR